MCDKAHASPEEAIECRNQERLRITEKMLERYSVIEMALHDTLRCIDRAKLLNKPELVTDNEGLLDQIRRALKHD